MQTPQKTVKVVIVDDSRVMRRVLLEILDPVPEIEVLGVAKDGREGYLMTQELQPDVTTLDIEMPLMDGLDAARWLMVQSPTPIVVLSALHQDGATVFEALRLGVLDFLPKPTKIATDKGIETIQKILIPRIQLASEAHVQALRRVKKLAQPGVSAASLPSTALALGTTICGPNTAIEILTSVPAHEKTAVFSIQALQPEVVNSYAAEFNKYSSWNIEAAHHGIEVRGASCYICSTLKPMVLQQDPTSGSIYLVEKQSAAPVDMLLNSVATTFQQKAVGVVLAGVGEDGIIGLSTIQKFGGVTLAQDTKDCVFQSLAARAISARTVTKTVTLNELVNEIQRQLRVSIQRI